MTDGASGPVRPAAVAGLFYPAKAAELKESVQGHLSIDPPNRGTRATATEHDVPSNPPPKAVIAPHAGYHYSGSTAGQAYDALAAHRGNVARVVVIGPAHRVPLEGVGLSSAGSWSTPLGRTLVDHEAAGVLEGIPGVAHADGAHQPEHSIEVHLPFIREVLGDVPVVPLVVGRASTQLVARVLQALWGGDDTVIVASSDLSHYLDDAKARARDHETAIAILEGRAADIGPRDACGFLPVGGLLRAATVRGVAPRLLDMSTSADATGELGRVVGYGSFAFGEPAPLEASDRAWLLATATRAIERGFDRQRDDTRATERRLVEDASITSAPPRIHSSAASVGSDEDVDVIEGLEVPDAVRRPGASFVTLTHGDDLLGCIGSLEPQRPLWRDVAHNARAAAFDDPRFAAIEKHHLEGMEIEVSVLSALEEVPDASPDRLEALLRPGIDGLVIAAEGRRATFLPDVWDKLTEPDLFLDELARKARWESRWAAGARAWRYTTQVFSERL